MQCLGGVAPVGAHRSESHHVDADAGQWPQVVCDQQPVPDCRRRATRAGPSGCGRSIAPIAWTASASGPMVRAS